MAVVVGIDAGRTRVEIEAGHVIDLCGYQYRVPPPVSFQGSANDALTFSIGVNVAGIQ